MKFLIWPSDRNIRTFSQAHPRLRLSSLGLTFTQQFWVLNAMAAGLMLFAIYIAWTVLG